MNCTLNSIFLFLLIHGVLIDALFNFFFYKFNSFFFFLYYYFLKNKTDKASRPVCKALWVVEQLSSISFKMSLLVI